MAEKTKVQILKEKKDKNRTFKENTAFGQLQDKITELELRVEELENCK